MEVETTTPAGMPEETPATEPVETADEGEESVEENPA